MNNEDTQLLVMIVVALISLVGNVLQYFFSPKRSRVSSEFDMAQTLQSITDAYDRLFENFQDRISVLENEVQISRKIVEELGEIKKALEEKVKKQGLQIEVQTKELEELRSQLLELQSERKELNISK